MNVAPKFLKPWEYSVTLSAIKGNASCITLCLNAEQSLT